MAFVSRDEFILPYIKNKKVLDLGFLGSDKKDFSHLHSFLLKNAKEVIGVDIDCDRINQLKKQGCNVICDNVLSLRRVISLNQKYDAIVAGELIEHLENPRRFLLNLKPLLKKESVIIITTPNMLSFRYILRNFLFGQEAPYWENRYNEIKYRYVIGFSKLLLENLFLRCGFQVVDFSYSTKTEYRGFRAVIEKTISVLVPHVSPMLIYVIKRR